MESSASTVGRNQRGPKGALDVSVIRGPRLAPSNARRRGSPRAPDKTYHGRLKLTANKCKDARDSRCVALALPVAGCYCELKLTKREGPLYPQPCPNPKLATSPARNRKGLQRIDSRSNSVSEHLCQESAWIAGSKSCAFTNAASSLCKFKLVVDA